MLGAGSMDLRVSRGPRAVSRKPPAASGSSMVGGEGERSGVERTRAVEETHGVAEAEREAHHPLRARRDSGGTSGFEARCAKPPDTTSANGAATPTVRPPARRSPRGFAWPHHHRPRPPLSGPALMRFPPRNLHSPASPAPVPQAAHQRPSTSFRLPGGLRFPSVPARLDIMDP